MDFSNLQQKKIKTKLKELFLRTGEEIISFDKELGEMKNIQQQKIDKEQSVKDIAGSINLAEEALYETLISNIELDAVLALSSKGFDLISVKPDRNSSSSLTLKKNGIDISLSISEHTRLLMEESIKIDNSAVDKPRNNH